MKKIKEDRRRYAACGGEDRRQQLWAVIKKYCPLSSSIFFYLLLSTFFVACSGGYYSHEAVRQAAEQYYSLLIQGDYAGFVGGYADAGSMPEDFRSQLADATAQFMAKDDMRNLISVEVTSDSIGEDSTAYVMLQLHFNDSTSEQVGLSLVLQEDVWKMR